METTRVVRGWSPVRRGKTQRSSTSCKEIVGRQSWALCWHTWQEGHKLKEEGSMWLEETNYHKDGPAVGQALPKGLNNLHLGKDPTGQSCGQPHLNSVLALL